GDPSADQGSSLPELGIRTRPVDLFQPSKLPLPTRRVLAQQNVSSFAEGLENDAVRMDKVPAHLRRAQLALADELPLTKLFGDLLPERRSNSRLLVQLLVVQVGHEGRRCRVDGAQSEELPRAHR